MKDNDPLHFLKFKRGEDLPQSKMTEEKVKEARRLHEEYMQTIKDLHDEFSVRGLARRYGVHRRTMEKIISGESWSHVG